MDSSKGKKRSDKTNEHAREVEKLHKKLLKLEEEKNEYLNGMKQLKADLLNEKRMFEERLSRERDRGSIECVSSVIPVLDSFDIAFKNDNDSDEWKKGIVQIRSQLVKALKENGVEIYDPLGEKFDHNFHTSVATAKTDKKNDDGKIATVLQKGYKINGRVFRPATVIVSEYKK